MIALFYIILAGISTFCFCVGKRLAKIKPVINNDYSDYYFPAITWGVFWPLGWAVYAPYLAARWFIDMKEL